MLQKKEFADVKGSGKVTRILCERPFKKYFGSLEVLLFCIDGSEEIEN